MAKKPTTARYDHPEASALVRPEVGAQAQFNKRRKPGRYRYDSSLAPELSWDGQNSAREQGEARVAEILDGLDQARDQVECIAETAESNGNPELAAALRQLADTQLAQANAAAEGLKAQSAPFLNWAGKAERLSFEVPTLPLFVHERLATQAILETVKGHRAERQLDMFDLFGEREMPLHEKLLKSYEHANGWTNRLILGDSLVVMNSLLAYEQLGGQVQMIYMDPPYGVKFGSNFQPFVRRRDVKHNDDDFMTREPEMVKAYRDTWELGLHSYLTYLRDRLLLCRELLAPSGSIFVQISDENLHHVREVMDEVFGPEQFAGLIVFQKTSRASGKSLAVVSDYLLWYAKARDLLKFNQPYLKKEPGAAGGTQYTWVENQKGERRNFRTADCALREAEKCAGRVFRQDNLTSQRPAQGNDVHSFAFDERQFTPGKGTFKTDQIGLQRLAQANRLLVVGNTLAYVRYLEDFPAFPVSTAWNDTMISGFGQSKLYIVQTTARVLERCILMTTDPGDLVFDPTCGSGTTAYVAEQWGRRWISCDTSRVPLALARQRLLTATFPYYQLKDPPRGPAGGFVYRRKQNRKGEEVGGIVPHITLKSIANDEPPKEEVLVDRPEVQKGIIRVTGPFCVEATIPTPAGWDEPGEETAGSALGGEDANGYLNRMLEILRRSPILHLGGGATVTLRNVRLPAKSLSLSAEALVDIPYAPSISAGRAAPHAPNANSTPDETLDAEGAVEEPRGTPVAILFGPDSGAVSEKAVFDAAREALAKSYGHLYVIGFAIESNARKLIESCEQAVGIAATYVQATPDLMMGDLLKNMRSSQIFSVCGLPEVRLTRVKTKDCKDCYQVELLGLDVFDPATLTNDHRRGDDVPAWLLDTDYNGMVFHVCQAFFPRTSAWNALKRALRTEFEDSVWEHLSGTSSTPFPAGLYGRIAVKVVDDRGNELMVECDLKDADPSTKTGKPRDAKA